MLNEDGSGCSRDAFCSNVSAALQVILADASAAGAAAGAAAVGTAAAATTAPTRAAVAVSATPFAEGTTSPACNASRSFLFNSSASWPPAASTSDAVDDTAGRCC